MPFHRLLTFDVTNTIMKFKEPVGKVYSRFAMLHGINLDSNELHVNFRRMWKFQNDMYPNFGVSSHMTSQDWWFELVKHTFLESGYRGPTTKLKTLSYVLYQFYGQKDCMEIIQNADEALTALRERGIQLGVISNFDERLEVLMKEHDLLKYFDFVLVSGKLGCCKPESEIFQLALEQAAVTSGSEGQAGASVEPGDAAHVGDNIKLDYHAARNAGLHAYLINQKLHSVPQNLHDVDTNHIFTNIQELSKYILSNGADTTQG